MSQRKPVKEIEAVIAANSRTPALVIGDLRGQVGAARLGERRIAERWSLMGKIRCWIDGASVGLHREASAPDHCLMARRGIPRRKFCR